MTRTEFANLLSELESVSADYLAAGSPDANSPEWLRRVVVRHDIERASSLVGLRYDYRTHVGRFCYVTRWAPYTNRASDLRLKAIRAFDKKFAAAFRAAKTPTLADFAARTVVVAK